MSVLTKYWTNTKMETMSKNTSSLASLCTRYIRLQDSIKQDYFFDESIALQDIMETISSNIGGEVFFVNANGKIIVANSNAVYATEGKFIDYEVVKGTLNLFLTDPIEKGGAGISSTISGFVVGTYWFLMLIGPPV